MAATKPLLRLALEGEGLSPADVPIRNLVELLSAAVGALEAVATEAGFAAPVMQLTAVRKGSAAYDFSSISDTAPEAMRNFHEAIRTRGAHVGVSTRRALARLYDASKIGALRVEMHVPGVRSKPLRMAPPIADQPLAFEHTIELQARVMGMFVSRDGGVMVRLRPIAGGPSMDLVADEDVATAATHLFNRTARAVYTEVVGVSEHGTLHSLEPWESADLLDVLRGVRDELAADGVFIDAGAWLEELEQQ
ncbi:MAG: hypothetical protein HY908_32655 [Myxococcales bacterium]|nr:hypothetical protein [Myxococcales bacterium]